MKRAPLETRRHFRRRVAEREQFLADIIITAVEGGVSYWATVFEYEHPEDKPSETRAVLVPNEDVEEAEHVFYAGQPLPAEWLREHGSEVETWMVERAIELVRMKAASAKLLRLDLKALILHASYFNEAGDIDADAADALVQIACFGKVVYG